MAACALGALVGGCGGEDRPRASVTIEGERSTLRVEADVADEEASRRRGLLAWPRDDRERALLLVWPQRLPNLGVSTLGLARPIDVVFIDEPPAVVDWVVAAPPNDPDVLVSPAPVRFVLELPARTLDDLGISRGSPVRIRR